MNSQPEGFPQSELLELCDRLLDQSLSAADHLRIEELVLQNAEARQFYVEYLHLHASLRQNASRLGEVPLSEMLRRVPEPTNVIRPRFQWPLKLAAGLLLGAGIWAATSPIRQSPPAIAKLVGVTEARWENNSMPTEPGSDLCKGRLRLADGLARIVFRSGAEVSLEGPGELELIDGNACFLHCGALVAHVPDQAHGFSVGTTNARLIDHGTDFGMSTDSTGRAQVQVLKGEVELQHAHSGETLRLKTKGSASITNEKLGGGMTGENEPDRYAFNRPTEKTTSVTITSAMGTGEAAYVTSPDSVLHASQTLLLLKNANTRSYLRKAYLRFDLSSLGQQKIAQAQLTLNFQATGFGYASLTAGQSNFAVYGVTNDQQDDWTAENLNWENAPAFAPSGGSVDPAKSVRLGSFSLAKGALNGACSISGPALAAFLNGDPNRQATLVIVRETIEASPQSAVHGFAGNRHPTLAPPTLRLTLAQP